MNSTSSLRIIGLSLIVICIGVVMIISATSGFYWSKSYPLSAGLAAFHEVKVDGNAQLVLHSPSGANFDLYAMHNPGGSGSCPLETEIMMNADKTTAGMESDILNLESGLWCIVVYAQSGGGTCKLEASGGDTGYDGTEWGDDVPDSGIFYSEDGTGFDEPYSGESPDEGMWDTDESGLADEYAEIDEEHGFDDGTCAPFKTLQYEGSFQLPESSEEIEGAVDVEWFGDDDDDDSEGLAELGDKIPLESIRYSKGDTYSFEVGGPRSDIELILLGMCPMTIPNHILTASEVQALKYQDCGISSNLYAYLDCNPHYGACSPIAWSGNTTPNNAYIRITEPVIGSTYYVRPEGYSTGDDQRYQLIIRSFQCYL
ncbi:hypothetical protein ACKUB1_02855 [Methanospirillum stamsii]|uniref:Uncharacterized protein n=1 Tax=Methanospirillum stamsii TaxID=1277351 RepID=A0A2V2N310_9EURY|nr:hypothetical protein [Methanospirillum stamsii]PWR69881.1 hypothetical protein DLD82_16850 [Methanospirillum stamsii]